MRNVHKSALLGAGLLVTLPLAAHAATISTNTVGVTARSAASALTRPVTASDPTSAGSSAPSGTARGHAAQVGKIATVSGTGSSASGSSTSSSAVPLQILGSTPTSSFGGTQKGSGTSDGHLVDAQPTSTVRAAATPWTASNSQSADGSSSNAMADILQLDLGDHSTPATANADVLQSTSTAQWTPTQSSSSGSTDGAIVDVDGPANLDLDALHAQGSTTGSGSSYLASINGQPVGTSQQLGDDCTLSRPGLLSVACLDNSGGSAGDAKSGSSEALGATVGSGGTAPPVSLFQNESDAVVAAASYAPASVSSGEGTGSTSSASGEGDNVRIAAASGLPAAASGLPAAASGSGLPAAVSPSGSLPLTGFNAMALISLALILLVTGAAIVDFSRRRAALSRK